MKDNNFIIELEQVCLNYKNSNKKNLTILDNISAQLKQGESVSITGPSGSGKTSLLMLIAGVEKPTSGKIIVSGQDISNLSEDQLALFRKDNVSIVFQNFHLIPTLNALENIALALELAAYQGDIKKEALKALDLVGLNDRANHYPEQLSGGEQQRVAIARAFVTKPKILLADEPTGNLDEENSEKIINLVFNLGAEFNTTPILITHDHDLAKKTDKEFIIKEHKIHVAK